MGYEVETIAWGITGGVKYAIMSRGKEIARCQSMAMAKRIIVGLMLVKLKREKEKNFKL